MAGVHLGVKSLDSLWTIRQNIIGSAFRSTAVVTLKGKGVIPSVKDDKERIFSIPSSPKKTSAGHSLDFYQVSGKCPSCEERKRAEGCVLVFFCLLDSF